MPRYSCKWLYALSIVCCCNPLPPRLAETIPFIILLCLTQDYFTLSKHQTILLVKGERGLVKIKGCMLCSINYSYNFVYFIPSKTSIIIIIMWLWRCYMYIFKRVLHIAGIQGVVTAYQNAISQVQLYGPTNTAPIINHVAQFAEEAAQETSASVGIPDEEYRYVRLQGQVQYIYVQCYWLMESYYFCWFCSCQGLIRILSEHNTVSIPVLLLEINIKVCMVIKLPK